MNKTKKKNLILPTSSLNQPDFIRKNIFKNTVSVQAVDPRTLIAPKRFDVLAKIIFLKFLSSNSDDNIGKKLYLKHLELLNGFLELDRSGYSKKIGKDSFILSFKELLISIKKDFNKSYAIPISNNNILDGAHRLAVAIFLKRDIFVFKVNGKEFNYNYSFFKDKKFPEIYLDMMANEYLLYKKKARLIFLWPTANKSNDSKFNEIINKHGEVVYEKKIKINPENAWVLIREVYKNEKWLGNFKNQFLGAKNKAIWCFQNNQPLRVILYESNKDLINVKQLIRNIYNEGKHSVHITDNYSETCELSNFMFNKNSIHWLNNYRLKKYNWFDELFLNYKKFLNHSRLNKKKFCIDGSSVLSIYGLREARDIDFIHTYKKNIHTKMLGVTDHNSASNYHVQDRFSLVNDPRYFFYYSGFKVISLEQLKQYKVNRNEKKDIIDLNLINSIVNKNNYKKNYLFHNFTFNHLKNIIYLLLLKIRFYIYKFIIFKLRNDHR